MVDQNVNRKLLNVADVHKCFVGPSSSENMIARDQDQTTHTGCPMQSN